MNLKNIKYLFLLVMAVFALSSCSENDDSNTEFANWQERNEKAFADTLAYARQQVQNGSDEWFVYLKWSLQGQTANKDVNGQQAILKYNDDDYIVVHVLDKSTSSEKPLYTDSIQMSYRGRLIPTNTYTDGYVFDQTFTGKFNSATAYPTKATVNSGWVDGFTTALLNMHVGERCQVFIPANLGYGETERSSIPGYSLLRFELALTAIKHGNGTWITQ